MKATYDDSDQVNDFCQFDPVGHGSDQAWNDQGETYRKWRPNLELGGKWLELANGTLPSLPEGGPVLWVGYKRGKSNSQRSWNTGRTGFATKLSVSTYDWLRS